MAKKSDTKDETGNGQPGSSEESLLTQEAVNALVQDRLRRQSASMLKKLGFETMEQLEAAIADAEAGATKSKQELEELSQKIKDAENQAREAQRLADEHSMRAAVVAAASEQGFAHPGDAFALIDRTKVKRGEDGNYEGIAEEMQRLVSEKRLPMRSSAPPLDAGAGGTQRPGSSSSVKLTPEELAIAKKMGLKPEEYARHKLKE